MKRSLLLLIFSSILALVSKAQSELKEPEVFTTEQGAIGGYDPVAFFTENKPVAGQRDIHCRWNEADWYFVNKENLEAFKANPEKYAPQYGGYCAYATASGHKYPTIPESWIILNNKLYFYFNMPVQKLWNKNPKGLIEQADRNWPLVKKQKIENP